MMGVDDISVQVCLPAAAACSVVGTELVATGGACIEDSGTFICRS